MGLYSTPTAERQSTKSQVTGQRKHQISHLSVSVSSPHLKYKYSLLDLFVFGGFCVYSAPTQHRSYNAEETFESVTDGYYGKCKPYEIYVPVGMPELLTC